LVKEYKPIINPIFHKVIPARPEPTRRRTPNRLKSANKNPPPAKASGTGYGCA
jgi:hypothetical protein